jgi:hypothetical protein
LPVPSQSPFVPQVETFAVAHWAAGVGAWAAGIGVQVPALPLSAHDMQVAAQAELQQTPCWQNPEAHCAAVVQAVPGVSSPQTPALQTLGDTQSALVAQEVSQTVALPQIRFPGQAAATTVRQIPEPSQVCAGVSVEPVQLAGTHWVPAAYVRQAPDPLQVPSVPQVEAEVAAH